MYQRKYHRPPSAPRRGGLGCDGFDTRPGDDASPSLIQRTVTFLRFPLVQKTRNRVRSATQLCAGATLVPARDAGACLASKFSPVCVVTKMCPPTHGRAARAKPACTLHKSPKIGRKGQHPHGALPAGHLQLGSDLASARLSYLSHERPIRGSSSGVRHARGVVCVRTTRCACRTSRAPAASCAKGMGGQSVLVNF